MQKAEWKSEFKKQVHYKDNKIVINLLVMKIQKKAVHEN